MLRSILRSYRTAFGGLSRESWLLALVIFVNRCGMMVLPFLVLYLTEEHGYSATQAGLLLTLYGVGSMAGIALGGRLTDVLGFRVVQVVSLASTGVTLFGLGQLESRSAIAATVVLLGIVTEAFRPANGAAVTAYSEPSQRLRAFGLNRLAINLGWTAGPVVGGFLATVDYSLLFWVDGATCLAAAGLMAWLLPKPRTVGGGKGNDEDRGSRSPWRDRPFLIVLALLFVQGLVFFQLLSTFPLFLRQDRGFSESLVGVTLAVNTAVIVLFEMQLIRVVERRNPLRVMGIAGLLVGLGFGLLPYAEALPWVMGTVVIWTFGEMLFAPVSMSWTSARASVSSSGRYMAAYGLCFSLSNAAAPLMGTYVYEHWGAHVLWTTCLALGGVVLAGFLWLAPVLGKRAGS